MGKMSHTKLVPSITGVIAHNYDRTEFVVNHLYVIERFVRSYSKIFLIKLNTFWK